MTTDHTDDAMRYKALCSALINIKSALASLETARCGLAEAINNKATLPYTRDATIDKTLTSFRLSSLLISTEIDKVAPYIDQ